MVRTKLSDPPPNLLQTTAIATLRVPLRIQGLVRTRVGKPRRIGIELVRFQFLRSASWPLHERHRHRLNLQYGKENATGQ